jgi:flagellin
VTRSTGLPARIVPTARAEALALQAQGLLSQMQGFVHSGAFEPSDSTIAVSGMAVADVDVSSSTGANSALVSIDAALGAVNNSRAKLGAIQNRFESTISNLRTTAENVAASRSRIQDADFAAETAMLTRAQILQQAGIAILSQANAAPQSVLTLLR